MYISYYIFDSDFHLSDYNLMNNHNFNNLYNFFINIEDEDLKLKNIRYSKDSSQLSFFLNENLLIKDILPAKIIINKIFNLKKSLNYIKNLENSFKILYNLTNVTQIKPEFRFIFKNKNNSLNDLYYFESSICLDSYLKQINYRYYFKNIPKKESNDFIIINNLEKEEIVFNTIRKYLEMNIEYNKNNYESILSLYKINTY